MRVLHILANPPTKFGGGVEVFVRNLIFYIEEYGIKCEILTTDLKNPSTHQGYLEREVKINFIKNYGSLWGINPIFNILPFLKKNAQNFDIIHAHAYPYFSTMQAIIYSKIIGKPTILTLHGVGETYSSRDLPLKQKVQYFFKKYIFDRVFGKIVVSLADTVASVSKLDLKSIGKNFSAKRSHNNYWIPNGVEPNRFQENENYEKKYITFIGRLSRVKGFDLFIQIAEKITEIIPSIPVLIIGQGEFKDLLDEKQTILNITYYPRVPYEEMPDIYQQTKIFVNPSRFEGLPTTILEAMASQTPVIATNVGGVSEMITDGFNGYLYEPDNVEKAATLIISLLNNTDLQKKFILHSKELVQSKFSWKIIAQKYFKLYQKLYKRA